MDLIFGDTCIGIQFVQSSEKERKMEYHDNHLFVDDDDDDDPDRDFLVFNLLPSLFI